LSPHRPACYAAQANSFQEYTMKVHHLGAFGAALFAITTSGASWAQDATTTAAGTDHSRFVGDFAIGFLGVQSINIADAATGAPVPVNAPVIGGRYWLDEGMGIDAGIGFAFASASITQEAGDTTTDIDNPQPTAFILHGGVPFALADSQYFVFELIPELNVGFAGNTVNDGDLKLRGFRLDIGARAGAEVHFGFIDIPQLSLQAGIGVSLAYQSVSATNEAANTSVSQSSTSFGTNVGNNPWDFFTSSISALYYFDR
jgi:hypothetical protein